MDISIITPFYKGNHYIQNLGKSLSKAIEKFKIRNNNICFEWVIVNDSPECPIDLSLLPSNFSCRIENHKKNEGIFRARITGLKAAKGKYILFLDQDDEIDSCFFEVMYPLIISGSADVAVCNSYMEDENGNFSKLYKTKSDLKMILDLNAYLKKRNIIQSPGQCLILKQSIPNEWINAQLKINGSDDLLLWILMLAKKKKFTVCPKALYTHKYTGKNLSEELFQMEKSSFEIVKVLEQNNIISNRQVDTFKRCINFNASNKKERVRNFIKDNDLIRLRMKYVFKKIFSKKV